MFFSEMLQIDITLNSSLLFRRSTLLCNIRKQKFRQLHMWPGPGKPLPMRASGLRSMHQCMLGIRLDFVQFASQYPRGDGPLHVLVQWRHDGMLRRLWRRCVANWRCWLLTQLDGWPESVHTDSHRRGVLLRRLRPLAAMRTCAPNEMYTMF